MTRSVEELKRESERSRAELTGTVEQLRERIADTAEDIRHKVSPLRLRQLQDPELGRGAKAEGHGKSDAGDRGGHSGRDPGAALGARFFAAPPDDWRRPCPNLEDTARSRRAGGGSRDGHGEGNARLPSEAEGPSG